MKDYMVDIDLPPALTPEFISLIPAQRNLINRMMGLGKITSYTLSIDRSKLWATFRAENEYDVEDLLEKWPLIKFMDFEIYELFFHEMAALQMPAFSMN